MNMVWGGLAASGRRKCDKSPESSWPGPWGYRGRLPQPYFAGLLRLHEALTWVSAPLHAPGSIESP